MALFNDFTKGKFVINCKTEEQAKRLCKWLHGRNLTWKSGHSLLSLTSWEYFHEDICYEYDEESIICQSKDEYSRLGFKIINFDEFMKEAESMKKCKFKVGQIVKVREWGDMEKEYGLNKGGNIKARKIFVTDMVKFCGGCVKIESIIDDGNKVFIKPITKSNLGWRNYEWSEDMFEECNILEILQLGVRCVDRSGDILIVTEYNGKLYFNDMCNPEVARDLSFHDEDLLNQHDNSYDIMKIYAKTEKFWDKELKEDDLLWEREKFVEMTIEEIEQKLGYRIKIKGSES